MADALIALCGAGVMAVVAAVILGARDARQNRIRQEQRPLEERICEIRESAAFTARQLQEILDERPSPDPEANARLATAIDYYRRLEALAAAPEVSADEILRLVDEAVQDAKQQRRKEVLLFIPQAQVLAALVRRRNAA